MTTYSFTVPGYNGVTFTYQADGMGGVKLFCDGKPMMQKFGKFKTTLANGQEVVLGLKYTLDIFSPKITSGKHVINVVPAAPVSQMILTYLPLSLVAVGGAIGGLCGALGAGVNHAIFRGKLPVPLKVVLSLLVTFAAFVLYAIAAGFAQQALNK